MNVLVNFCLFVCFWLNLQQTRCFPDDIADEYIFLCEYLIASAACCLDLCDEILPKVEEDAGYELHLLDSKEFEEFILQDMTHTETGCQLDGRIMGHKEKKLELTSLSSACQRALNSVTEVVVGCAWYA